MKLVLIHGRSQGGKDPEKLQNGWVAGLRKGLKAAGRDHAAALDVSFPFYGDRIAELMKELKTPTPGAILRGTAKDEAYEAFLAAVIQRMAARGGLTEAEIRAESGIDAIERGWFDKQFLQATVGILPKKIPWLQRKVIEETTNDVWQYLTRPSIRKEVDAIVRAGIPDEPCVVISHSLGTVVAYRVLVEGDTLQVPLFVTAGSPLGMPEIKKRLTPPVLGNPACTQAWLNATDRDDVVALVEKLDHSTFSASCQIENIANIDNGDNAHAIERYLADPRVAAKIADALGI